MGAERFNKILDMAERSDLSPAIKNLRKLGLEALQRGIHSVLPENLIREYIQIENASLIINEESIELKDIPEILIVGGGKATGELCRELIEIIRQKNLGGPA